MNEITERRLGWAVLAVACLVACLSVQPTASSWNDGSRLAAVESLAERGTLCIDDSVFVRPDGAPAYGSSPALARFGTLDKMCIDGRFYSDKSPVPTVLLAPVAVCLQSLTGTTAREEPARFCLVLGLVWNGLAYVVAVWCAWQVGRPFGLGVGTRLLLAAALAFGTVALPYSRSVNNHLPLLAVAGLLTLEVAKIRAASAWRLGCWAGLAYTIDLGVGPALFLGTAAWVGLRLGWRPWLAFAATAGPWLVLHHALNWSVGGTLRPANANPDVFRWPGCPFVAQSLTGSWRHPSVGAFLAYAFELILGRRGILWHAMPLFLAVPGMLWLVGRRSRHWPELLLMLAWSGGPWLVYAAGSNNLSGQCCSVRWFVPLLAPGWFGLAVLLREWPKLRADVAILAAWGTLLTATSWWQGPWCERTGAAFWVSAVGVCVTWASLAAWRLRAHQLAARVDGRVLEFRVSVEMPAEASRRPFAEVVAPGGHPLTP